MKICKKCKGKLVPHKEYVDVDWETLKKNQSIKVLQGTGPIYHYRNGETENFGYFGIFRVVKTEKDGILIVGKHGFSFIYMGDERKLSSGTTLRAHKIKLEINNVD